MKKPLLVIVNDRMQANYRYQLIEPIGKNSRTEFRPELTPKEMLEPGIFGGKYMTDCRGSFPEAGLQQRDCVQKDMIQN